ncbi:MAG: nucleotide pyrophosphohydrolase [Bacillota bacterium]|nr:nucleotide pyrophosphohydrolase [Bacillota bacterium]
MKKLNGLKEEIIKFRNVRDWKKFHTPENLSKSISIEAGELLENFQWGDEVDPEKIEDELADVLIYSFLLADAMDVDPIDIMNKKIERNKKRFPISKVKGNSGKFTKVDD